MSSSLTTIAAGLEDYIGLITDDLSERLAGMTYGQDDWQAEETVREYISDLNVMIRFVNEQLNRNIPEISHEDYL